MLAVAAHLHCSLQVQASKDCVQKTITRMEQKFSGRVLAHVVFMLRSSERAVQQVSQGLRRQG